MGRTKPNVRGSSDADRFVLSQMYQCQQYLASRLIAPGFNLAPEAFEAAALPLLHRKDKLRKAGERQSLLKCGILTSTLLQHCLGGSECTRSF
jgi:hypothetical protein